MGYDRGRRIEWGMTGVGDFLFGCVGSLGCVLEFVREYVLVFDMGWVCLGVGSRVRISQPPIFGSGSRVCVSQPSISHNHPFCWFCLDLCC